MESAAKKNEIDVWVLTDGKIGDDVQCLAVASGLSAQFERRVVRPRPLWSLMAPWGPVDPTEAPGVEGGPLEGQPPALVIASGRRAIPYARALKRASKGRTRIILLKDPRMGRDAADVLWAPAHDRVEGANVFTTLTSPHGLSAKIEAALAKTGEAIADLPRPLLGVILGGPSGGASYSEDEARALSLRLNTAGGAFGAVAVTPSRRTPDAFLSVLKAQLSHQNLFVWDGVKNNPYIDIIANASSLIVAGDSHNMMSEALASSAGVYVWRPAGIAKKMQWFLSRLEGQGEIRSFGDEAVPFQRSPRDATPEIVKEIKARLFGRQEDTV